uniref:Reverse transcriptase zinc-binding domain-containing protein n=1 Tax=Brassica oleracea TaxID=3712 RepID=A0A3P6F245_BRAOL|nr:unnamed protein product [Brassica oleracea]
MNQRPIQSCQSSFGNIRELLRLPSYSALGITPTSTLHDIHRNGVWLIWAPRSDVQVEIHALLTTITLNTDEDRYEWCPNGSTTSVFSTGAIYRLIKQHQPLVPWNKVVWNPRRIPKHSFLTWLVIESYLGASKLPLYAPFATWRMRQEITCSSTAFSHQ